MFLESERSFTAGLNQLLSRGKKEFENQPVPEAQAEQIKDLCGRSTG